MIKPPQLLPMNTITHLVPHSPALAWVLGGVVVAYLGYRFVYRVMGKVMTLAAMVGAGMGVVGLVRLHRGIATWQKHALHPVKHAKAAQASGTIVDPLSAANRSSLNLNAMSPLAHENAWLIALVIVVVLLWGIGYLIYRATPAATRAQWMNGWRSAPQSGRRNRKSPALFPITPVEVQVGHARIEVGPHFNPTLLQQVV